MQETTARKIIQGEWTHNPWEEDVPFADIFLPTRSKMNSPSWLYRIISPSYTMLPSTATQKSPPIIPPATKLCTLVVERRCARTPRFSLQTLRVLCGYGGHTKLMRGSKHTHSPFHPHHCGHTLCVRKKKAPVSSPCPTLPTLNTRFFLCAHLLGNACCLPFPIHYARCRRRRGCRRACC